MKIFLPISFRTYFFTYVFNGVLYVLSMIFYALCTFILPIIQDF